MFSEIHMQGEDATIEAINAKRPYTVIGYQGEDLIVFIAGMWKNL